MPTRIGPKTPRRLYLRQWREYAGLTQQQVADRLGENVSKGTVSRWETRKRHCNPEAYAEALGVPVERLYTPPPAVVTPKLPKAASSLPKDFERIVAQVVAAVLRKTHRS